MSTIVWPEHLALPDPQRLSLVAFEMTGVDYYGSVFGHAIVAMFAYEVYRCKGVAVCRFAEMAHVERQNMYASYKRNKHNKVARVVAQTLLDKLVSEQQKAQHEHMESAA